MQSQLKFDTFYCDPRFETLSMPDHYFRSLEGQWAHGPQYDKIRGDTNIKHILQF